MTPEKIIEKYLLVSLPNSDLTWKLIRHFEAGFPIENLRLLIETSRSTNSKIEGLYIAQKLGWLARPVREEIGNFLDHRNEFARMNAIYALRVMTTPDDKEILGKIGLALDDVSRDVQKAAELHIKMNESNALIRAAGELAPGTVFEEISDILPDSGVRNKEILAKLVSHSDPLARRIGVAIAERPSSIRMLIDDCRRQLNPLRLTQKVMKLEENVFHLLKTIVEKEYDLFPELCLGWKGGESRAPDKHPITDLTFKITKEYTLEQRVFFENS